MEEIEYLPAGVDIHVHFREPGYSEKEDMKSGMYAARAGGITSVIDMPNTIPVVDSVHSLHKKKKLANSYPGIYLASAMTSINVQNGNLIDLAEITKLFKVFMVNSTGDLGISKIYLEKGLEILEDAGGCTLMVHAEDPMLIKSRVVNSIELNVRPIEAEISAVKKILKFARKFNNINFHITHVSSESSAKLLSTQSNVSWDVLAKYLDFDTSLINERGNYAKMNPPLRTKADRLGMNILLQEEKIPMLSSDHAPHTHQDKKGIVAGAPGVQELYPSMIDRYLKNKISKKYLEKIMFENPKTILRQSGIKIVEEQIEIDRLARTTVDSKFIKSKCGWSLWENRTFQGKIRRIIDL